MTDRGSRDDWAAQIAALDGDVTTARTRKAPITVARIVETAFRIVAAEGFDALTMRRVAGALQTGPASLYAHVRNKAELDGLLIGALVRHVEIPEPDPEHWREQVLDVCRQLRDEYGRYPGISRAAFENAPNSVDTARITEGLLAILVAAGASPRDAAWTIDALFLYVGASSLEQALRRGADPSVDQRLLDHDEVVARLEMLPADRFPITVAHAREITGGTGEDRFDHTITTILRGLTTPRQFEG
jgi:AcrR family transcriptional regulator